MKKIVGALIALLLMAAGGWLIWSGLHQPPEEAPQLSAPISAPATQTPVGPTEAPVKDYPKEEKGEPTEIKMTPEKMAPNHLYIPALGVYGRIDQKTGDLVDGSLTLPQANEVTRWKGGSNVTSDKGNILIAGHVSWNGVRGLVYPLVNIKAGNLAYVTDGEGNREEFQLQTATTIKKSALPKEVWDTTGPKQLVVVTCGGDIYRRSDGSLHFDSNVIATFVPVVKPEATPSATPAPTSTHPSTS